MTGMARIQVVIDEAEREAFRAMARAEGRSLSEWLREAGRERLHARRSDRLATEQDVRDFFAVVDADREAAGDTGREEDWEMVKARMESERYGDLDPLGLDP